MKIATFDTTLRAGTQGESISFSVDDKLLIAQRLDELGIDYVEGGWPGSNPKDKDFFARAGAELKLKHARLVAYGATRFARHKIEEDRGLQALLAAGTPVAAIFHGARPSGIDEDRQLKLIAETVAYLKANGKEVIFDAEHFFDGYQTNAAFALRTLETARKAGADVLCLCDTNGGTRTGRLTEIFAEVRQRFDGVLGIQAHNDSDLAVANTLAAVEAGATHVQGCMNGYGERCGNANLCSVIANLELKVGHSTIGKDKLPALSKVARYVAELANLPLPDNQPFVGRSAFAHKGGAPVAELLKEPAAYEHIAPETVGNRQRLLISDLSGRGNVLHNLKQHKLAERLSEEASRELLERIKQMQYEGYELDAAEGTFELLVRQALQPGLRFFEVEAYDVTTKSSGTGHVRSTANVTVRTHDGMHSASASGHGPFHALHMCLRKCLSSIYPRMADVRLIDYKVRVLEPRKGTAAKARVLVEWSDHRKSWSTVGISDNVTVASWNALVDAIRLELMRLADQDATIEKAIEDYCWGV